jgi:hypothetical protein
MIKGILNSYNGTKHLGKEILYIKKIKTDRNRISLFIDYVYSHNGGVTFNKSVEFCYINLGLLKKDLNKFKKHLKKTKVLKTIFYKIKKLFMHKDYYCSLGDKSICPLVTNIYYCTAKSKCINKVR